MVRSSVRVDDLFIYFLVICPVIFGKPAHRPPGAAAAARAGGSQAQAAAPEAAPDRRVPEAARAAVPATRGPAAGAH